MLFRVLFTLKLTFLCYGIGKIYISYQYAVSCIGQCIGDILLFFCHLIYHWIIFFFISFNLGLSSGAGVDEVIDDDHHPHTQWKGWFLSTKSWALCIMPASCSAACSIAEEIVTGNQTLSINMHLQIFDQF